MTERDILYTLVSVCYHVFGIKRNEKGTNQMKTLTTKGKLLMVLSCLLYSGESVLLAAQAYVNGRIVECAEAQSMAAMLWTVLAAVLVAVLIYFIIAAATWARLAFLANGELDMKRGIMRNILRRPLKSFRGEKDAFYLNLLSTDVQLYRGNFLNNIPFLFCAAASVAASAFVLCRMNLWLFLSAVFMAIVPMVVTKPFAKLEQRKMTAYSKESENYTNTLKEVVEGYETIRTGNSGENFRSRFEQAAEGFQRSFTEYNFVSTMSFESLMSVAGLSSIVCLGVGGWLAAQGALSIGMLFSAMNYFSSISNNFTNIFEYIIHIRASKKTIEKLEGQRQMECVPDSGLVSAEPMEIVYDGVSFSFGERRLYDEFSYRFGAGGCYAIVGESGSGKSTLVKLLLKYHDDYSGNILLAGQDIRRLSESEIYARVGVVDQAPYLFNAPLYENIVLFGAAPERDSEEYKELLEKLSLSALAERVGNEPLGDFGDNISGGERQRIAVARALIKHAQILIFDEPTASLDPDTRDALNELIFALQGYTRIVITHDRREDYLSGFDGTVML